MSASGSNKLTPQQRLAIETVDDNLLVSAAAGSGKTTVLAERCAYLLCDAPNPCNVEQLLVVTFTEAAAAQMKTRIEAAIQNRLDNDSANESLRRHVAQIDRAQVSTLHGFCANLLRMHFHLLSLEANFNILDQEEAALLRRETVSELFADRYGGDQADDFQRFIDWYGDGSDAELQRHVLRAHGMLCTLVEPELWLTGAYDQLAEAAENPLPTSILGRQLIVLLQDRLHGLSDRFTRSIASLKGIAGLTATTSYIQLLADEVRHWARALGAGDLDALAGQATAFESPRKPPLSSTHPHKAVVDSIIKSLRQEMDCEGVLGSMIRFTSAQWQTGLRSLLPSAKVFLELVRDFGERYQLAKQRVKGVDFADLERLALQLLRTKDATGRWIPSPVARQCHQRFAHVLVDEYQDINALQDEILRLVSRECLPQHSPSQPPNLFAVGDVKQSIYRFRLADPQRFLERDRKYRAKEGGRVIDLQQNFRSRAPLLQAINSVFEKLMTRQSAMIEYDQSHRLHPGAVYPAGDGDTASFGGSPIELHVLHTQDGEQEPEEATVDRTEWEATLIARRIQEMLDQRFHVADSAEMRKVEYRDIVILLRSAIHKADQIGEVLSRHGIPVHSDARDGFFQSTEIRDMLALLQLLDNSQQDIPLAAFLRSPLAGLEAAENSLGRIRLAYPSGEAGDPFAPSPCTQGEGRGGGSSLPPERQPPPYPFPGVPGEGKEGKDEKESARVPFHLAVFRYAEEQTDELAATLRKILQRLARWRSMMNRRPLAEVIWSILDETGYLTFCAALDRGRQRTANLLAFHQRARDFGSFASQGLYRFLRFLHGVQEEGDLGQPSMLGEGENAVRIMTVHQSKGLEFPVVFLPDLGKGFNLQDMNSRILLDRSGILGIPAVDEARQVRYPSLGTVLARQQMRQQIVAEELRVLYVAMTRAREHLILMGTCTEKQFDTWSTTLGEQRGPLPGQSHVALSPSSGTPGEGRGGGFAAQRTPTLTLPRSTEGGENEVAVPGAIAPAPLPAETVIDARSPLQWLAQTQTVLQQERIETFAVQKHSAESLSEWSAAKRGAPAFTPWQVDRAQRKPLDPPPPPHPLAEQIIERLMYLQNGQGFTERRAAISVTEWAKAKSAPTLPSPGVPGEGKNANPFSLLAGLGDGAVLPIPRCIAGETPLLAVDRGVATHLVLQHATFHDDPPMRQQVQRMIDRCLLTEEQADAVDYESIHWFMNTDVGSRVRTAPADHVLREIPFALALDDADAVEPLDRTMLRGRIDLLLRDGEDWIVLDYKTDRVTKDQLHAAAERYRPQVDLYRQAIKTLVHAQVSAVYLVFLHPRHIHRM